MDVLTFGESMVVFSPNINGPLRHVHTFSKSLGGAESNVATALAKLNHSAGWFSKVSDDEFGRFVISSIKAEGVDTSRVIIDKERPTGLLFKERYQRSNPNVYYYRKNSAASSLSPEDIDEEYIKQAKILHITGITPALSESCRRAVYRAIEIAKENKILVSFDPNIRLKLWTVDEARKILVDIASKADIVMPGLDEAELLLGLTNKDDVADFFLNKEAKIVAVKLGSEGCYIKDKKEGVKVAGYNVSDLIQDTAGAGDGFAAGFLAGYLEKLSLNEIGQYANGVGAMATLVQGDMEGYPYYDQLMEFIGKRQGVER
ncbi:MULTISPECIES: sugar kinase [Clostridium]|jgi:5-dehydro-2-deoxygluconokinase (EC 2.7.1.92)|uniref:2-dehydro-3-deoxygluconokinase n=2 Tax=Clostridium beijerinckii TaxID=1520 RepID=A0A1S8NT95_CLOBE|nr:MULTISPECIES: sugar kinase [Clostridium]ABR34008.1 PfkB domain protein [Clostridium beijerinckii NCIMB 8052]AIU03072.1 ribokinase-like domain-containing protein [Clostridium beijerinckii ATCC 35702]MBE6087273.1 sugar kinase [Clostridium beijerinckii]MBF7811387.1 sugar kinase [Clostridium beijerinckii]NOW92139.1 2-dehydro-3-deoxygluconokinase [Clostridium beijerinckii]